MPVTLHSAQVVGLDARPISVEVDISPGLHLFAIVGLADKEIQESRERIAAAIKNLGALAPHKKSQRVIVNLAPADIKKEGPAFDLAIALGYLTASGQIACDPTGKIFLGELGLDGGLRRISGVLPIALAARRKGFTEIILPPGNGREAALVPGIRAYEVSTLLDACEWLAGRKTIEPVARPAMTIAPDESSAADFKDISGQNMAKRVLEIAAAGGHHALLEGPPGAGKTALASAIPSILPPMSEEEIFEVSTIYSVAGLLPPERDPWIARPPFRNPHHTSSPAAVIGGGTHPRPGEATLAHRGVLFLDEFPEFDRRVIESLRQPLEQHTITVARSAAVQTFPARFMLVAAQNPCPCGNFGNAYKDCVCSPGAVTKYKKKISGPILDRIDLYAHTPPVSYERLEGDEEEPSSAIRERVIRARGTQKKRFAGTRILTNAEMGLAEIKKYLKVRPALAPTLKMAHEKYRLSARSYHRLLKISRTIADLESAPDIEQRHIAEALEYRPKQEL